MTGPNITDSTGAYGPKGSSRDGSSLVQLWPANPDDRPTVITGSSSNPSKDELIAGQTLGHFELLDTIGRGGMATVLRARDLELGRIVALKILPPEMAQDGDAVSRFKQEARSAARLDHDHIARVYFCGEDRGLHFIAFEFVAGENLRERLDHQGKLSPADAVRFLIHVTSGLKHAAERGVVHRDIKPSNIILTPEGQAKIVDMGLARHLSSAVNGGVTQSGVTLGTFDYISPEQALDPRRADLRSDIYSLGCTFYHALTGRPPVPEGTAAKKLHAHHHEAPIDPRDLNPAVPESLAAVLARMMAKNPDQRYPTADALLQDLNAVALQCGFATESTLTEGLVAVPAPTMASASPRIPVLGVLAGLAMLIAVIVLARPVTPSPAAPPWSDPLVSTKRISTEPLVEKSERNSVNPPQSLATSTELQEALNSQESLVIRLRPGTVYDLSSISDSLHFRGPSLVLEADNSSASTEHPPILRLPALSPGAALSLRCSGSVTIRGIDLEIESRLDEEFIGAASAAIEFENVPRVTIQGCRIRSSSSAAVTGFMTRATKPCEFSVKNTIFDLGAASTACVLSPSVRAEFVECAFGPHRAALAIDEESATEGSGEIRLSHCTFLLDRGAALRVPAEARTEIQAGYCLFASGDASVPEVIMPGELRPARNIVLQISGSSSASRVRFNGMAQQANGYFLVSPLALNDRLLSFSDINGTLFQDVSARMLTRSPWAVADPRPLTTGSNPAAAFRISLSDPRLRLPPVSGAVILGASTLGATETRIYPGPWPPERPQMVKAAPQERIVWPEAEVEDAALRLYPTFAAAFGALQPGETLSIAVTGPVPIPLLADSTTRTTIRAVPGYRPILVPEGPGFTTDAVLFRLASGELVFEGLEISLRDRQAVVSVSGGAVCTFRRCTLTLSGKNDAVAVIPDPAREMKGAPGADDPPRVHLESTILRGEGRGIWVQAARPFDISLDNCAAALDGTLLVLEGVERSGVAEAPKGKLTIKHTTAVLTHPLIEVKTGRTSGGPPAFLTVDAEACLLASADIRSTSNSLIMLEDAESTTDPARYISWTGTGVIYGYSESADAVEWRNAGQTTHGWDWSRWLRVMRDDGRVLSRLRFARGSLKPKLASAEPADFVLSAFNPLEAGVDTEKLAAESR